MRLMIERNTDPRHNLAREETLLTQASGETVYLWRNRSSVIIGRHQNTLAEIDEKAVKNHGVTVVRRLTGGGAVFQDLGNINVSFLFNSENFEEKAARGCLMVIDFLASLGVDAQLSGRNDICVQSPDGSMVKIAGTAMTERKGGGIFHCCVLFDCDLQVMEEVLTPAAAKFAAKGIASVRSRVANLKDLAPQLQSMSGDGFFETWADYLSERCEFDAVTTAQEKEETEKLMRDRYQSWQWNYGRNPAGKVVNSCRFPIGTVHLTLDLAKGRVKACTFSGDFINQYDFDEITTCLTDVPFDRGSLAAALGAIDLCKFFAVEDKEFILDFMTGRRLEHEKN